MLQLPLLLLRQTRQVLAQIFLRCENLANAARILPFLCLDRVLSVSLVRNRWLQLADCCEFYRLRGCFAHLRTRHRRHRRGRRAMMHVLFENQVLVQALHGLLRVNGERGPALAGTRHDFPAVRVDLAEAL